MTKTDVSCCCDENSEGSDKGQVKVTLWTDILLFPWYDEVIAVLSGGEGDGRVPAGNLAAAFIVLSPSSARLPSRWVTPPLSSRPLDPTTTQVCGKQQLTSDVLSAWACVCRQTIKIPTLIWLDPTAVNHDGASQRASLVGKPSVD